jgi:hypothetical protein
MSLYHTFDVMAYDPRRVKVTTPVRFQFERARGARFADMRPLAGDAAFTRQPLCFFCGKKTGVQKKHSLIGRNVIFF